MSLDPAQGFARETAAAPDAAAPEGAAPEALAAGPVVYEGRIERLTRARAAERLPEFKALLELALAAQRRAHVPYSHFPVGAAVLTGSGHMAAGCNVESASYGATICAERTAVTSAIAAGETSIVACVVVTPTPEPSSPCGICRQLLAEFGPDVAILAASSVADGVNAGKLSDFLPLAFAAGDLVTAEPEASAPPGASTKPGQ